MPSGPLILTLALQIATGTTVESILPTLIANGERYAAALPSLVCEENAISRRLKGEKIKEQVTLQGSMQILRTGQNLHPFEEQYHWLTRNGQPVADGKKVNSPYFLHGAFANGLGFTGSGRVACFEINREDQSATTVLNLKRNQNTTPACADIAPGRTTRVTVDRATGHVSRLEASMPANEAEQRKQPFYVAIDYQPTILGEETFWLPTRVESHNPTGDRRIIVTYANCRRFTASMKIVAP